MKITLIGYGKMGKAIHEQALQRGHTVPLIIDIQNKHELTAENLQQTDVVIEFTTPETAFENVSFCLKQGVPVICGSTGWLSKLDNAKNTADQNQTGLIVASNFS
ncbi:MAG: NAD(P)-binding domain-containing protein, partial [Bacteroidota bacterium]